MGPREAGRGGAGRGAGAAEGWGPEVRGGVARRVGSAEGRGRAGPAEGGGRARPPEGRQGAWCWWEGSV